MLRAGCAKEAGPLVRCDAFMRGGRCAFCVRGPDAPDADWDGGPGWNVLGKRHVQAVRVTRPRPVWATVVFTYGRKVDGRFPIILSATRATALSLAFDRAKQICPRSRIRPFGRDQETWSCGDVLIMVADPDA